MEYVEARSEAARAEAAGNRKRTGRSRKAAADGPKPAGSFEEGSGVFAAPPPVRPSRGRRPLPKTVASLPATDSREAALAAAAARAPLAPPRQPGRPPADDADFVLEFERFTAALMPRTLLLEAPIGFAKTGRFVSFRARMAALGYRGAWRILDSVDFGVPCRRRRLVYLAGLGIGVPLSLANGGLLAVRDAIRPLPPPGSSLDPAHTVKPLKALDIVKLIPKDGGSLSDIPGPPPSRIPARALNPYAYSRLRWDSPAPEARTDFLDPARTCCLHPVEDRIITLREFSLITGFPANYRFPGLPRKRGELARLVGAASPPAFICAQAKNALKALYPPEPKNPPGPKKKLRRIHTKRRWKNYLSAEELPPDQVLPGITDQGAPDDGAPWTAASEDIPMIPGLPEDGPAKSGLPADNAAWTGPPEEGAAGEGLASAAAPPLDRNPRVDPSESEARQTAEKAAAAGAGLSGPAVPAAGAFMRKDRQTAVQGKDGEEAPAPDHAGNPAANLGEGPLTEESAEASGQEA
ncbi:MAG: DNA cytosine methyltransferase [Deltaproteobacteria bacterium]|nr:DNA cytosine methyltransferase [Deltaproteobacteria bacterium]